MIAFFYTQFIVTLCIEIRTLIYINCTHEIIIKKMIQPNNAYFFFHLNEIISDF